jgi:hypothetical protein
MPKSFGVFLVAICLSGCSVLSHEAPAEDVDKAAALFVQRLNAADYETIYKDSAEKFKESQTKETIVSSLKELTERGRLQSFHRIRMNYESGVKDRIVSPVYITAFEQSAGELTLNFVDTGGEWKLIGFSFKQRT